MRGRAGTPRLIPLDSAIRPYAWGSRHAIPEMLGREPDGSPAAELWIGAHPDEPSRWRGDPDRSRLDDLIQADRVGMLGEAVVARFGPRLPYLLKLLAAEKALSLQVHPNLKQAQAGFAEENRRGVPPDAPERNYRDPNHKPELLCALTEFEALCGFRPVPAAVAVFEAMIAAGAGELAPFAGLLRGEGGLRAGFTALLQLRGPERAALVAAISAAAPLAAPADPLVAGAARAVSLAAHDFPGDIGIVVSLLLNYLRLQPGEAIFLAAGNVHAYLRGFGVEILANSDNVLRCGLTPKHIDVPELLRITDFTPLHEPRSAVEQPAPGVRRYPVPVPDFVLSELTVRGSAVEAVPLDSLTLDANGPHLVLCTDGSVVLAADGEELRLPRGAAAFVAAGQSPVSVTGDGVAYLASTAA